MSTCRPRFRNDDLLALDEAFTRLEQIQPCAAEVVNLCYFVGLTHEEAAEHLGVSVSRMLEVGTSREASVAAQSYIIGD